MPIYRLRCTVCHHVFEELLGMSESNPTCPNIDANEVQQGGVCGGATERIPAPVSRPLGGDTPIHYRNRGAR